MAIERYRPGPQTRCGVCPECCEDFMRQYGAKYYGAVHRYYYACQACQFVGVWREVDEGGKAWEQRKIKRRERE